MLTSNDAYSKRLMKIYRLILNRKFGISAFLVPLGLRAIPELLVGPYPVGWDTIASYAPTTLDWASGRVGVTGMLESAPLLYSISTFLYVLLRMSPVMIFKVLGPLLYGAMIYSVFRFMRTSLDWTDKIALSGSLLTSLYFVTLRISWDLYRTMLGLTFVLASISLMRRPGGLRKQLALSSFIVLAVASNELTAVIICSLTGGTAIQALRKRNVPRFLRSSLIALPGIAFLCLILYSRTIVEGSILQQQPALPSLGTTISTLGFMGYAYLPLLPLILVGMRVIHNAHLRLWSVVCALGATTSLLPLAGLIVMSYRWSLLMDVPFCVYAMAGLHRLTMIHSHIAFWKTLRLRGLPMFFAILSLSSVLYIALPAQRAVFGSFPTYLPTSMIQNTVPLSDMGSLKSSLEWVSHNMDSKTVLITHMAIYGWARTSLPSQDRIIEYGYSNPEVGLKSATQEGYRSVFLIWWVKGLGLHGLSEIPARFVPVHVDGNIAVYSSPTLQQ